MDMKPIQQHVFSGIPSAAFVRLCGPRFPRVAGGLTGDEWMGQEGRIVDVCDFASQLGAGLFSSVTAKALADAVGQDVPLHRVKPAVEIARLRCAAAIQAEQQTCHNLHGAARENQHKGHGSVAGGDACKRRENEEEKAHSRRDQSPEEASVHLSEVDPVTCHQELKLRGRHLLNVLGISFGESVERGANMREVLLHIDCRGSVQRAGDTFTSDASADETFSSPVSLNQAVAW
jgi:hypothetical protein